MKDENGKKTPLFGTKLTQQVYQGNVKLMDNS
jgi:hypothetical protein